MSLVDAMIVAGVFALLTYPFSFVLALVGVLETRRVGGVGLIRGAVSKANEVAGEYVKTGVIAIIIAQSVMFVLVIGTSMLLGGLVMLGTIEPRSEGVVDDFIPIGLVVHLVGLCWAYWSVVKGEK